MSAVNPVVAPVEIVLTVQEVLRMYKEFNHQYWVIRAKSEREYSTQAITWEEFCRVRASNEEYYSTNDRRLEKLIQGVKQ